MLKRNLNFKSQTSAYFRACLVCIISVCMSACSTITDQQNRKIGQLSQQLEQLEQHVQQNKQVIARLKQKESDLNLLIKILTEQTELTGYRPLDDSALQLIEIIPAALPASAAGNVLTKESLTEQSGLTASQNEQSNYNNTHPPQFAVQIASLSSVEQSKQTWLNFQSRFAAISQNTTPLIESLIKDDMQLYRLKIGPYSRQQAQQICIQLKQLKQSCLINDYSGMPL